MTMNRNDDTIFYKTRLRGKGQLTLPVEVRERLSLDEGDDLLIRVNEAGRIEIQQAITVPSEQAYFWSERWQALEKAAQADIDSGRVKHFSGVDEAISDLERLENAGD